MMNGIFVSFQVGSLRRGKFTGITGENGSLGYNLTEAVTFKGIHIAVGLRIIVGSESGLSPR